MEPNLPLDENQVEEEELLSLFQQRNYLFLHNWCQKLKCKIVESFSKPSSLVFEIKLVIQDKENSLSQQYLAKATAANKKDARLECCRQLVYSLIKSKEIYKNQSIISKLKSEQNLDTTVNKANNDSNINTVDSNNAKPSIKNIKKRLMGTPSSENEYFSMCNQFPLVLLNSENYIFNFFNLFDFGLSAKLDNALQYLILCLKYLKAKEPSDNMTMESLFDSPKKDSININSLSDDEESADEKPMKNSSSCVLDIFLKFNLHYEKVENLEEKLKVLEGSSEYKMNILEYEEILKCLFLCYDSDIALSILDYTYQHFNLDDSKFVNVFSRDYYYHKSVLLFIEERDKLTISIEKESKEIIGNLVAKPMYKAMKIGKRFSKEVITITAHNSKASFSVNDILLVRLSSREYSDSSSSLVLGQVLDISGKKVKIFMYLNSIKQDIFEANKEGEILIINLYTSFHFSKSLSALKKFCCESSCSLAIRDLILSTSKEEIAKVNNKLRPYCSLSVERSKGINDSQYNGVCSALENSLTLIVGPPGTGKTFTAIEIVKGWKALEPKAKILLCCDSNISTDKLFNELLLNNVKCLRVGFYNKNPEDLYMKYSNSGMFKLTTNNNTEFYSFFEAQSRIKSYDIVCCTLFGSISDLFKSLTFEKVIIDECSQATELNSVFPISYGCNQLVLIGDEKQLPPCVFSRNSIMKGFSISLFERLRNINIEVSFLNLQYRMHPSISAFSSQYFYNNQIINGPNTFLYEPVQGFSWPNPLQRWTFIDSSKFDSKEEFIGLSLINSKEVDIVISIMKNEHIEKYNFSNIGVITPYDAQKQLIKSKASELFGKNNICDVDTVDGYQGMEKELIIISLVRANKTNSLGFLTDYRRLNVSLTRAKKGLVIIGNIKTLESDKVYGDLINHAKICNCLI